MNQSTLRFCLICACVATITIGCASLHKRNTLPESLSGAATIPGISGARQWADTSPPEIDDWLKLSKEQIKSGYPATFGQAHTYLAISGGGQRGAFGAGLLNGWTETGTRPEFTMVTGVSTGALIAPFAFLGPEYDPVIREIYTTYSTKDFIQWRSFLNILRSDAATDSSQLRDKIVQYVDEEVVAAIAREHERGRMLHVVTTNLDAARPVVWNIGHIAASGSPNALQLIHDVLLASASIPAAFPPVMIDVEADGERYDELHVDGGATSIMYLYPIGLDWAKITQKLEVKGKPKVYILRNGQWNKSWEPVKRRTIPIAVRTIDSLMGSVVQGDAYRIYLAAQRDGIDYNLALMPDDFNEVATESFDTVYMNKLFDLGYRMGAEGYQWRKAPPGFDTSGR
jgi:predicted patatin/cPLA2 family phospholipase